MMTPRTEYLLHKLRTESLYARSVALHAQSVANEFDTIGVALRGGLISSETAVEWACEIGGPDILGNVPPEIGWASEAAE